MAGLERAPGDLVLLRIRDMVSTLDVVPGELDIFEIFEQIAGPAKSARPSTLLALVIYKAVVAEHLGTNAVKFTSEGRSNSLCR